MDAILERCAGLDVHQETVVACVMYGPLDRKPKQETKTFSTTTKGLLELHDWLHQYECTHIAMESTGVYWKPVWNVLEGSFTLVLANAKRIKNVPGRKTDVKDAAWIAQLLRCGLITPSFVPPENIRDLRDYTRYRRKLLGDATAEKNRIHKILRSSPYLCVKLPSVRMPPSVPRRGRRREHTPCTPSLAVWQAQQGIAGFFKSVFHSACQG